MFNRLARLGTRAFARQLKDEQLPSRAIAAALGIHNKNLAVERLPRQRIKRDGVYQPIYPPRATAS